MPNVENHSIYETDEREADERRIGLARYLHVGGFIPCRDPV